MFGRFVVDCLKTSLAGGARYRVWLALLSVLVALGATAYGYQLRHGLIVTGMSDFNPWGAYIANFTFLVGMVAAAVMLVVPAYAYRDHALRKVVVLGELLAMVVVILCLLFVTVDIGRPERVWHFIPGVGRLNFPASMLAWDVVVLSGYLVLNAYISGYLLYARYCGREPERRRYVPFVALAVVWAISVHTVTAFLYSGLGGRPYWNTAILAPRFLATAFAAGPAVMIIALSTIESLLGFPVGERAIERLRQIMVITLLVTLYFLLSETFTTLYAAKRESSSTRYLFFGLHGHRMLMPYAWAGVALEVVGTLVVAVPRLHAARRTLLAACGAVVVGVWIEKGMALLVPGFVPSPLGEVVEYFPTLIELAVSLGIWALGALLYTLLVKAVVPIELGQLRAPREVAP